MLSLIAILTNNNQHSATYHGVPYNYGSGAPYLAPRPKNNLLANIPSPASSTENPPKVTNDGNKENERTSEGMQVVQAAGTSSGTVKCEGPVKGAVQLAEWKGDNGKSGVSEGDGAVTVGVVKGAAVGEAKEDSLAPRGSSPGKNGGPRHSKARDSEGRGREGSESQSWRRRDERRSTG